MYTVFFYIYITIILVSEIDQIANLGTIKLFPDPTNVLMNKLSSGSAWTYTATEDCFAMVYGTDSSAIKATLNGVTVLSSPSTSGTYSASMSLFMKTGDVLKITSGLARGIVLGLR